MTESCQTKPRPRPYAQKQRRCLLCGADFASEGPHNRICKRCKSSQAWRRG